MISFRGSNIYSGDMSINCSSQIPSATTKIQAASSSAYSMKLTSTTPSVALSMFLPCG